MEATSNLSRTLEPFVKVANEVIYFKLVRDEKQLAEDVTVNCFKPELTHQFFGDAESIFGYRDLQVKLFYTASKLIRYMGYSCSEQITPEKSEGVPADNFLKQLQEGMEGEFENNLDVFSSRLAKESDFKPYGELLKQFTVDDLAKKSGEGDAPKSRTFEVYKAGMEVPGFQEYHQRMQTFLKFFIDAASYIDVDDNRWDYFVIYEKLNSLGNGVANGTLNGDLSARYFFAGYMTVYRFYGYPEKIRPRVSQMLVLPPFQGKGVGAELLQIVYDFYLRDSSVRDICVEDPSDNFVRLRDFVDSKNCLKLKSFSPEKLKQGFSDEMVEEATEKLKMSKKQIRRVYEILRLKFTNLANEEEYKEYRLDVKGRLNAPFQKQKNDLEKLEKSKMLSQTELKAAALNQHDRLSNLESMYKECEDAYKHTIEKLANL